MNARSRLRNLRIDGKRTWNSEARAKVWAFSDAVSRGAEHKNVPENQLRGEKDAM